MFNIDLHFSKKFADCRMSLLVLMVCLNRVTKHISQKLVGQSKKNIAYYARLIWYIVVLVSLEHPSPR